jgi:hypothetical protein
VSGGDPAGFVELGVLDGEAECFADAAVVEAAAFFGAEDDVVGLFVRGGEAVFAE